MTFEATPSPPEVRDTETRRNDYKQAGFGHRLGAGQHPALLVVDLVQAYLRQGSGLFADVAAEAATAGKLAGIARATGIPVVLTRVSYQAGGADGGLFYRKVPALRAFIEGSPDAAFAAELDHSDSDLVVTKQYASAFFGTPLASTLHTLGVDTVLIAGLTTSGCVRATAVDALGHGFRPLVVADAVGDRDADIHRMNLFDLDQKYADVIYADEAQAVISAAIKGVRP